MKPEKYPDRERPIIFFHGDKLNNKPYPGQIVPNDPTVRYIQDPGQIIPNDPAARYTRYMRFELKKFDIKYVYVYAYHYGEQMFIFWGSVHNDT
jgi:hypothetical protein